MKQCGIKGPNSSTNYIPVIWQTLLSRGTYNKVQIRAVMSELKTREGSTAPDPPPSNPGSTHGVLGSPTLVQEPQGVLGSPSLVQEPQGVLGSLSLVQEAQGVLGSLSLVQEAQGVLGSLSLVQEAQGVLGSRTQVLESHRVCWGPQAWS